MISSCRLHATVLDATRVPEDGRPQIAFMGRSNVGKSSLINRALGRKGLAYTSKTPGRTQGINFYLLNERIYFVDLPGYGYARVPMSMREQWKGLVEGYLDGVAGPDLAVQLIDARHGPTELDLELYGWLRSRSIGLQIVLTKIDKLPGHKRSQALTECARLLDLPAGERVIGVSAVTGDGIPELWRSIDAACATILPDAARARRKGPRPTRRGAEHESRTAQGREPRSRAMDGR